ncbi:hypothetical protein HQQ88_14375 [Curtobacterium sp. VKM Ac-2861]|uniref:hypothetical protein n=1 Tax=Curtobacterium sp. VKM Ac-2861 TaxID=2739016 RepID=UPI001566968A|nr:hypothetical protein [Curtobacterium sp. VKM Ac-2861]
MTATQDLVARVASTDNIAKSAVVSGTATPGAKVTIGSQETTADSSDGSWSITVTGLKNGANELTAIQKVNGTEIDRKTVTATIVEGGTLVPGTTDPVNLQRGATTDVPFTVKNNETRSDMVGPVELTAPTGTTFDATQTTVAAKYRTGDTGSWNSYAKLDLKNAVFSDNNTRARFTVDTDGGNMVSGEQYRYTLKVITPANAQSGDSTLNYTYAGTSNKGAYRAQGSTSTKVNTAALTAKVDSVDNIAKTATVSGKATPGAKVSIGSQETTASSSDGSWSITVTGLKNGANSLTAIQKVGSTEIDRQTVTATITLTAITGAVPSTYAGGTTGWGRMDVQHAGIAGPLTIKAPIGMTFADVDARHVRDDGSQTNYRISYNADRTSATVDGPTSSQAYWGTSNQYVAFRLAVAAGTNNGTHRGTVTVAGPDGAAVAEGAYTVAVAPSSISPMPQSTVDLKRGSDTDVSYFVQSNNTQTNLEGTVEVVAPTGTTFAPNQTRVAGQWRTNWNGDWAPSASLDLKNGRVSDNGKKMTFDLGPTTGSQSAGQQFRWNFAISTPQNAEVSTSGLTYKMSGTSSFGGWEATGSAPTRIATAALTAKVDSVDNIAKTATVSGKATPGAKVSIGSQETTANASTGAWTLTVTGLKNGANSLTAIQKVGNTEIDRTTVTATIVEGGTLVPIAQGPIDLTRDGTTKVPFVVQNNETRTGTKGTVVLTAPAGTTFPAQATAGGEWRVVGASGWSSSRAIPLTNGRLSNDNKTLTFDVDWPASHAEREQYRFMIDVTTPANAAGGDSSMGFVFAGTSNKGAHRAEGSTSTKLSTALTAKVDSVDNIAKTATVSGKATPGAKVSIGSQETTANASTGAWTLTVTGLKNGANSLTAIQKVGNTEIDRTTVTATIVENGGLSAGTSPSTTLKRGATTGVPFQMHTDAAIGTYNGGKIVFTAPEGTTFPAQTTAPAQYRMGASDGWKGDSRFALTNGVVSNDGKTLTFDWPAGTGEPVGLDRKWTVQVAAPADIAIGSAALGAHMTGSTNLGSIDLTGSSPTMVYAVALTATAGPVDHGAKSVVVSGTATPGASVSIGDQSVTADRTSGTWSLTVGGLEVGDNELVVIQKINDREIGRVTVTATVEGSAELAPITLSGPASVTPGRSNTFTGKAEPGATYRVLNVSGNQIVPGIRDVDDQGNWTFDRVVSNGASNFRFVIEQTKNGQVATSELFTINATALAPVTVLTPERVTPGRSNTFTGKAEPGATYRVLNYSGNQIVPGIHDVDNDGNWTFNRVVSNGAPNFRFVIEQTKNGQVEKSELFTIDAAALTPVTVLTPERVTPGRSNTFTGTGEPGATYRVLNISGTQIVPGTHEVGDDGNWTFNRVVSNGAPNFRFVIEQTKNGQIEKSELFTIDAADFAPVTVRNRAVTPGVVNTFTGTGEPGATYRVLNITGTQIVPGTFEVDSEGEWRFDRAVSRGATEFRFALEQTKNGKTELSELFTLPADTK